MVKVKIVAATKCMRSMLGWRLELENNHHRPFETRTGMLSLVEAWKDGEGVTLAAQ
jgi:hypothetical protein